MFLSDHCSLTLHFMVNLDTKPETSVLKKKITFSMMMSVSAGRYSNQHTYMCVLFLISVEIVHSDPCETPCEEFRLFWTPAQTDRTVWVFDGHQEGRGQWHHTRQEGSGGHPARIQQAHVGKMEINMWRGWVGGIFCERNRKQEAELFYNSKVW